MCFCVKSFPEVHSLRKPLKTEEDKYLLLKTTGTMLFTFAYMIGICILCNCVLQIFTIFWSRRCSPSNLQTARNCHQPTFRPHCHKVHLATHPSAYFTPLSDNYPFSPQPPFPNPKLPPYLQCEFHTQSNQAPIHFVNLYTAIECYSLLISSDVAPKHKR